MWPGGRNPVWSESVHQIRVDPTSSDRTVDICIAGFVGFGFLESASAVLLNLTGSKRIKVDHTESEDFGRVKYG